MQISWLKSKNDKESFKIFKGLGFPVYELEELENTDKKLTELIESDYKTIVVSNEVAGFSENIIKRYDKNPDVSIIIASSKRT